MQFYFCPAICKVYKSNIGVVYCTDMDRTATDIINLCIVKKIGQLFGLLFCTYLTCVHFFQIKTLK